MGDTRIRTDKHGRPRAWIKTAEPNTWRPRAQVTWERAHGPIPGGLIIHHANRDTLDDAIENLTLISLARHINEHRREFEERRVASVIGAKRRGARLGPLEPVEPGFRARGEAHHRSRLTESDVLEIRRLYATGEYRQTDLAERFGVRQANISQIVRRLNWQHI